MQQKAKLLFTSSRPISWVNTAFPFAATYLFITHTVDLTFIVGTLFFLIPYNLLMYGINDVYDYESDIRNPRKGGVEGAVVAKKYHKFLLAWSYLLPVPFAAWLCVLQPQAIPVLLACLFFVVAYSAKGLRFKEIPFLDSITSSLHFVGPMIYALSITDWPVQAWLIVLAFFAWGMASQSMGAIQDIDYDKQAGIHSIGTAIGAKATLYFALVCYLLAVGLLIALGPQAYVVAAAGVAYVINILPAILSNSQRTQKSRRAWKNFMWLNYVSGAVITITLIIIAT